MLATVRPRCLVWSCDLIPGWPKTRRNPCPGYNTGSGCVKGAPGHWNGSLRGSKDMAIQAPTRLAARRERGHYHRAERRLPCETQRTGSGVWSLSWPRPRFRLAYASPGVSQVPRLLRILRSRLQQKDSSITAFNVGTNCGETPSPSIMHV